MQSDVNYQFQILTARISAIYSIDGIGDPECPPEWVREMCESLDGCAGKIFNELKELNRFVDSEDYPEDTAVAEALVMASRKGFIVCAEHAIRSPISGTGGYSYSWGYYRNLWVYAEAADEMIAKVVEAIEASHARDLAKAAATPSAPPNQMAGG